MKSSKGRTAKLLALFLTLFAASYSALAAPIELSLDDSVALALKNNSDIKIAESAREKTYWAVKQTEAGKGVSVDIAHSDTRYSSPIAIADGHYSSNKFDNQLSLSLPIYSGGKLETQIDQAKINLKIADLNIDAVKQQLKQNVTTYYFNVLQYRNELQVNQETVDNYSDHLKIVQAKYDIGTVAKVDVLASQVDLANAQDNLIKAQNNYELAVANLNNAIGLSLDSELKLNEVLYKQNSLTLDECVQYALVNRPEMAEYQAKIASAAADVKIAQSAYRPTVDLSVAQGWYDKDFPGLNNSSWQVGITASLNVFDSGLNKAKVQQSRSSLNTAQEEAKQQRDTILLEVREYYLSMHEAEKRITTKKVAVEQAEESLKIAKARYQAGVGTNVAVLDAVLSLNQAKINNVQALYDYNTSKAKLDKAMGVAISS